MKVNKYIDVEKGHEIDIQKDCCDFQEWMNNGKERYLCSKHQDGFYVFLNPIDIENSNEYQDSDPYTVIENYMSDFHQRRINCTIDLISKARGHSKINLLDLGCGQGHITGEIKKNYPEFEISGLDYSLSAIQYANNHFPEIDFIVANAYEPPYVENYFDIVICNNLWEHVPDPLTLLKSIDRIIKPGGYVIISTPSRYRLKNLIRVLIGREIIFMSEHHVTEYSIGQIKELLEFGGYSVNEIYSPPIREKKFVFRIIKAVFKQLLQMIGSHHILEQTVFTLAKKNNESRKEN